MSHVPAGYHIKTVIEGDHQIRIATPPGPGKTEEVVSVLHPEREVNCSLRGRRVRNFDVSTVLSGIMGGATFAVGNKLAQKYWPNGVAPARRKKNTTGVQDSDVPAMEAWKHFHGRDPRKIYEMQEAHVKAGTYSMLGRMGALWLMPLEKDSDPNGWPKPTIEWNPSEGVRLASNPEGTQYYFMGGDQNIGSELPDGEYIDLGTCYGICYITEKSFHGFRSQDYAHQFGEVSGARPSLWYCRSHARLLLVGGDYTIAKETDKGASLGIEN